MNTKRYMPVTSERVGWEFLLLSVKAFNELPPEKREFCKEVLAKQKSHFRRRNKARASEDRLAKPLTEEWRRICCHDGETVFEYRIFPGDWSETLDEEIEEIVRSMEVRICSPYDCTGKLFTHYLEWKRVEAGLCVVHCLGLDV